MALALTERLSKVRLMSSRKKTEQVSNKFVTAFEKRRGEFTKKVEQLQEINEL